jgi:hypothetical protein
LIVPSSEQSIQYQVPVGITIAPSLSIPNSLHKIYHDRRVDSPTWNVKRTLPRLTAAFASALAVNTIGPAALINWTGGIDQHAEPSRFLTISPCLSSLNKRKIRAILFHDLAQFAAAAGGQGQPAIVAPSRHPMGFAFSGEKPVAP